MFKLIRPLALFIMIAAMASSYHTQLVLFRAWNVDLFTAGIAPFAVDALAVICAIGIGTASAQGKGLAAAVLVVTLGGSMAANFLAGATLGSKIVHAGMVAIYAMAELVASKVRVTAEHNSPRAPAAAPTSPGMPPLEAEPAEVLAFREAQRELRRTSKVHALNGTAAVK
jgi:hypothetical protein